MERSTFRETSVVVVASLAFSGLAVILLACCRALIPRWMPDLGAWIGPSKPHMPAYLVGHYRLVLRAIMAEVCLAMLLVAAVYRFGPRQWRQGQESRQDSLWNALHQSKGRRDMLPVLSILSEDGVTYHGQSAFCDSDRVNDPHVVLSTPVTVSRPGSPPVSTSDTNVERVVISLRKVSEIWITYIVPPEEKSRRLRRR